MSARVSIIFFFILLSSLDAIRGSKSSKKKIPEDIVVLVSCDGFRWGYQFKVPTPNMDRLRSQGIEADKGLIPVYPSLTYPNHYSIATGLYPASHGIINNAFRMGNETFTMSAIDSKWWLGEPIWSTVVKNGLEAVSYFWPGAEVVEGPWTCSQHLCPPYNMSVPFEARVDSVLATFDGNKVPSFVALYFDEPDTQGHRYGPDSPEVDSAISKVDLAIGRLLDGIESRKNIARKVTFILVGDHGMVSNCESKYVFLEDLAPWVTIDPSWVDTTGPILSVTPPKGVDVKSIVEKMKAGLSSGKVTNGKHLTVYLKEDLPKRLMYYGSDRIQPIIGIVDEGYSCAPSKPPKFPCGGSHGYDNKLMSMRSIFIARGPRIPKGRRIKSFSNVNIYNLITEILGLDPAPNNGSISWVKKTLRSKAGESASVFV